MLPKKLSAMIRVALADLAKVERSKRYTVNMHTWHTPVGRKCEVCLAGAVLAKTLRVSPTSNVIPYGFAEAKQLRALDFIRGGDITGALAELHKKNQDKVPYPVILKKLHELNLPTVVDFPSYEEDRAAFKQALRSLARRLEEADL